MASSWVRASISDGLRGSWIGTYSYFSVDPSMGLYYTVSGMRSIMSLERKYHALERKRKHDRQEFERDVTSKELHLWDVSSVTQLPLVEFITYINGKRLPHGVHCSKCNQIRKLRKEAKELYR